MAMDEQTRALMQALEQNFPRVETMTGAEARAAARDMPRAPIEPEPVGRVQDTTADGVPVRIYWPKDYDGGAGPLPMTVFFHGGGWVLGDVEGYDGTCRTLTNEVGCITVSVDYRLAPEHPFPAPAEDCYTALSWAAAKATDLGADPDRIAVGGDSAGGNLAAVVALMARDRGGPPLRAQLIVYGVFDCDFANASYTANGEGYFLTRAAMEWFWRQYAPDAEHRAHPYCTPLRAESLAGLPSAYVITAEYDPLRDEGEVYARRLEADAVPVTLVRAAGMFHGFFSLRAFLEPARAYSDQAYAAVRQLLS